MHQVQTWHNSASLPRYKLVQSQTWRVERKSVHKLGETPTARIQSLPDHVLSIDLIFTENILDNPTTAFVQQSLDYQ